MLVLTRNPDESTPIYKAMRDLVGLMIIANLGIVVLGNTEDGVHIIFGTSP
jgi:hypothetical protein